MSLKNRYADAYLVAQAFNGTGQTVKLVGFVVAALVILCGLLVASKMGVVIGIAGLLFGVIVALPFYVLGVLVSAQGQILKATLDVAVHTSSIPSPEEIRNILAGSRLPVVPAEAEALPAQNLPGPMDTSLIASASNSLLSEPSDKRSCPHCGGVLESGVSRCRWCMEKV
jgi:hypothetical protein